MKQIEKTMSSLTVLITTQNRVNTLSECLNAIFLSSGITCVKDIIVVDDGSTDGTPQYLRHLLKEGEITTVIRNDQAKGPATGRNQGLQSAKGKYTLIMGDDVILFQSTIELFHKHIQKHGLHDASVIGNILPSPDNMTAFEYWSCNGGSQFGHHQIPRENEFDTGEEYFYTSNIVTPTAILKEHPFEESFPYARYEDRELGYRLKRKINHKIHYLADAKSYHQHKSPFKKWLQNFEQFTWSALHFSNLYPDDIDLKTKLGIVKALEMESFQNDVLENAVQLINRYHKQFFHSEASFGQSWIKNIVSASFRSLQEFFRINYYRKHLSLPYSKDKEGLIDNKSAMRRILSQINKDA